MSLIMKMTTGILMLLNASLANELTYKLTASNLSYSAENELEFEIHLLNTSENGEDLIYFLGRYLFEFNKNISDNNILKCKITGSDLTNEMRPSGISVFSNQIILAENKSNTDIKTLPVISRNVPGTLVARIHMETVPKKLSGQLFLKWKEELPKTKIAAMINNMPVEITNEKNHTIDFTGLINDKDMAITERPYKYCRNHPICLNGKK